MLQRVFAPFTESRDFRLMWAGACTSSIGTWMQKLAQSWLVLEISGSPFWLGVDAFLGESPVFLFAIVAGAVADRVDRRKLLIASQVVQMTCAAILAALFAFDVARIWHILVLSFVVGTAQSFGAPSYQALLPGLVRKELLPGAIAMNSIQFNLARILGPVLGGFALQSLGAAWCFGLNSLSYLAAIYALLVIRAGFLPAPTKESLLDSMKAGVRFMRRQPEMESLIAVAFLMTFLGLPMIVYLPVFAKMVFHGGVGQFTLLQTIQGVGAIFGAILVAARSKRRHVGRDALLSLIGLGVFTAAFALSNNIWLGCALLFAGGMAIISCFALVNSLVQYSATEEMRGRVLSVYNIAFRGGGPIGSFITGGLVVRVGVQPVVASMGALLTLLGLWMFLFHKKLARL